MLFQVYVGIDYSGAGTPSSRSGSLQAFFTDSHREPQIVKSPGSTPTTKRNWNRIELHDWLSNCLQDNDQIVVGIDHGFSFPISYFEHYKITDWDAFLDDFVAAWPTDSKNATVEQFRIESTRWGDSSDLRFTERWTSSAKSVFQFDVQGSVAKSTHAGLPFLRRLRKEHPSVHFWPFDGFEIPQGSSVVAEVYPSLFRNRFPRADRTVDQQDAYSVCRWLQEMDIRCGLERFFNPPLDESEKKIVALEGWILGVT